MEERKTIFDYIGQILMIFGVTVCILNVFCVLFGEGAKEYSTIFALGKEGLAVSTMMQFLLVSVCTAALRFFFFTDTFIKKMTVPLRTVCMVTAEVAVIAVFIVSFGWFPVDMWQPWAMFILCFGICFIVSAAVTVIKTRLENQAMEKALARLKRREEEN
ncbi:MAG: hypothetical protein NC231_14320 [Bacillus sp. (in: Bacteria)]|nr:hypothetical protein [Bacillus sp. (in: firmicutes)]MCM1427705.1 hypothetical protein [Eubacterium sp.]